MGSIVSRVFKPSDFSEGLWHEVLVTLSKRGFSPEMATEAANAKSGKADEIVGLFQPVADFASQLTDWQSFCKTFFGLDVDFSGIRIPERRPGFDRLLFIAQGLTPNLVCEACRQSFPCWRYTEDLDSAVSFNERATAEPYAIWVRDMQEADDELKNLSANQIKERGTNTETLTERLVHGLKYWSETKKHLDERNITLCAGSRYRSGDVPRVRWDGDWVNVGWDDSDFSVGYLRARQVVS